MLKMANRFKELADTGKWPTTIQVKDVSEPVTIEVKRYIEIITPSGEVQFMTPKDLKTYTALGLSVRSKG